MNDAVPPLVRIEWEDAACLDQAGWVHLENPPVVYKPVMMLTVGFLLLKNDKVVVVTGSWSPHLIGPRDQIPMGMVRKLEYLQAMPVRKGVRKT